jgi:hypothetical protein
MGDPAPAPPPVTEKTIQLPHDAVDLVEECFHTSATIVYWIECPPSDPEVSSGQLISPPGPIPPASFRLRPRHDAKPPSLLLVAWGVIYDSQLHGYVLFYSNPD